MNILLNREVKKIDGALGNFKITLDNGEENLFGFIVFATGGVEYKPEEYGYGKNKNIITQLEFEDLIEIS